MKKYLLLILLVAIGFGQDSQDTDLLILKKGARYEGEFLGVKSGKVHFKPKNVRNVKPRRLYEIKELTQNGNLLIQDGKWMVDSADLSIKSELQKPNADLPTNEGLNKQYGLESDKTNSIQKLGGLFVGVGGLLLASTYQHQQTNLQVFGCYWFFIQDHNNGVVQGLFYFSGLLSLIVGIFLISFILDAERNFRLLPILKKELSNNLKEKRSREEQREIDKKNRQRYEIERLEVLKKSIIQLLKDKPIKMPTSDIDAHLKHKNLDEIKVVCQDLYEEDKISFAGNGRYFILSEDQEKPNKTSATKSKSTDIPEQIKKLSDLKDQGILTEEEFQSKKKDLLDKM